MTNRSGGTDYFEYDLYKACEEGNFFEKVFHNKRRRELENFTSLQNKTILDFGCNTGAILVHLLRNGLNASGFDISKNNIDQANVNIKKAGLKGECYLSTLPNLRWDVIMLINVLEYVSDKEAVLDLVTEHLSPDGNVIVCIATPWHPFIKFESLRKMLSKRSGEDIQKAEPAHKLDKHELIYIFTRNGYRLVKQKNGFGLVNKYFLFKRTS